MKTLKTLAQQRASLIALVDFATNSAPGKCNYGAMLLLSRPGDVAFLAPVAPELRGIEIVSALSSEGDNKDYDIWRNGNLYKTPLTAGEVLELLNSQCQHAEADYMRHIQRWAQDTLIYYGVPNRDGTAQANN